MQLLIGCLRSLEQPASREEEKVADEYVHDGWQPPVVPSHHQRNPAAGPYYLRHEVTKTQGTQKLTAPCGPVCEMALASIHAADYANLRACPVKRCTFSGW